MKKSNLFFIIILLSIVNAHVKAITVPEVRLKYLYYENYSGEKGKTTFYYSEDNINYKAKWELLDGSRSSINYHFFDKDGNMTRKYREFSDSITSNNFYKYDEAGNLIEDYFERSDKVKGIVWYKYENGKKIEAECRGLNGWFTGIIEYKYTNDLLIEGLILKDGKQIGSIEYKYDEYGNLLKEHWDFGGKWTQTFTNEYELISEKLPDFYSYSCPLINNTKDFIVSKEDYDWNGEGGGLSFYEYDGNKLIQKIYKYDSLETITSYEYDNEGLLMKSFRSYSDGRKAEFSYHYNEMRQLVRRLFHGDNGFEGSESYEYNENGTLKLAKWDKYDTWITGTITFEYDANNMLKSGLFKGVNNMDADLSFVLDEIDNLIKIHWEFSFGKTQTYWFEYDKL